MHNRQALSPKLIWDALKSYHIWPLYFISLTFNLPTVPVTNYLQISFRSFGFSRPMANLLAVPSTVFSIINLIIITLVSEAVNNRSFVCMTQTVVSRTARSGILADQYSGSSHVSSLSSPSATLIIGSILGLRLPSSAIHGSTQSKYHGCPLSPAQSAHVQ